MIQPETCDAADHHVPGWFGDALRINVPHSVFCPDHGVHKKADAADERQLHVAVNSQTPSASHDNN